MARVTVEDCIDKVQDRFELVAVAFQRAKDIAAGAPLTIQRNGEKNTVLALREIGDAKVEVSNLRENLVRSFQTARGFEEDVIEQDAPLVDEENYEASLDATIAESEAEGEDAFGEGDTFADENLDVKD